MLRYRDRHRLERRREFLAVARRLLEADGIEGLTVQRLTRAVGSSTGGVYVYFPTKDAILWALACDSWGALTRSHSTAQVRLAAALTEAGVAGDVASLTRVMASALFWADAEEQLPIEVALARRVLDPTEAGEGDAEARAASWPLLTASQQLLDAAAAAGSLGPGEGEVRALLLLAALTGVLTSALVGEASPDRYRLAARTLDDVLVGWGATRAALVAAETELAAFRRSSSLAPAPGR